MQKFFEENDLQQTEKDQRERDEENTLAINAAANEQAFTALYNKYFDKIYGFVIKRINHTETCEDLVSEIMKKVFLHLKNFNPKKASFRTWIYRIATNTIIDHYRTHHNPNKPANINIDECYNISEPASESPHNYVITQEEKKIVAEYLGKLSKKDRKIVELKYFDEFSAQEIAEILNISPNAVYVRSFRAIKRLQSIFNDLKQ